MGVVWRARDERDGAEVAVKLLANADRRAFVREARVVAGLQHPNIVAVWDYGEVPADVQSDEGLVAGEPWLAMELLTGGSLASRAAVADWVELRRALEALLAALAHAHARGVLHRDVKPANLLRDAAGNYRLVDFGIASTVGAVGPRAGTRGFLAPEVLAGRPATPSSDLYAVGVTAWQVVTGALPEAGQPFAPRIPVPPDLADWLTVLISHAPSARFAHAAEALGALPSGRPVGDEHRPGLVLQSLSTSATFTFEEEPEAPASSGPVRRGRRPPVPPSWEAAQPHRRRPTHLGLGLTALRSPPLVGRVAARRVAWDALLEVVRTGRPITLHVQGEPGIGRATFVDAMIARVRESGCAHGSRLDPAAPLVGPAEGLGIPPVPEEAAEVVAGALGLDGDPEVRAMLTRMAGGAGPRPSAGEASVLVARACALLAGPVVLGVRLHPDFDTGRLSVELRENGVPALLLVHGDDGAAPPDARSIMLGGLDVDEGTALLRSWAGLAAPLARSLAARLSLPAELVAAGRALALDPDLVATEGGFVLAGDETGERWLLRAGAGVMVDAKLAEELRLGVALGPRISAARWREACDRLGAPYPASAIDAAVRAGSLVPADDGYRVTAVLEHAVAALPPDPRTLEVAAAALEGERWERAADLWAGVGRHDQEVRCLLRAVEQQDDPDLAHMSGLAARAARRLTELGRPQEALHALSWEAWTLADRDAPRAREIALQGLAEAERSGFVAERADFAFTLVRVDPMGPEVRGLLLTAEAGYRAAGRFEAAEWARLARVLRFDPLEGIEWLGDAPEAHDPRVLTVRPVYLAAIHAGLGQYDEARRYLSEVPAIWFARASGLLEMTLLTVGQLDAAAGHAERGLARVVDPRSRRASQYREALGLVRLFQGRLRDAEELVADVALVDRDSISVRDLVVGVVAASRGDARTWDTSRDLGPTRGHLVPVESRVRAELLDRASDAWAAHGDADRAARAAEWRDRHLARLPGLDR